LAESAEALMNVQSVWLYIALNDDRTLPTVAEDIRDSGRVLLSARRKFAKFSRVVKPEVKSFLGATNPNRNYLCALARYVEWTTKHKYSRDLGQLLVAAHWASGIPPIAAESFERGLQLLRQNKKALFHYETAPFNFDVGGTFRLHALSPP
jgi:hypothetical protein